MATFEKCTACGKDIGYNEEYYFDQYGFPGRNPYHLDCHPNPKRRPSENGNPLNLPPVFHKPDTPGNVS